MNCEINNDCLKEAYFKLYMFMQLPSTDDLLTYETYLPSP